MAIWIDVRTADEFRQGHLLNALNIPYDAIGPEIAAVTMDKNAEIYLFCGTGRRSGMALHTLKAIGYTNVHNIDIYEDLKAAGKH